MKRGFTLIELSLSIAFISILSIIIVLLINNSIASYRRGLTLNQINTVGMDLVDDIRTVVQSSPSGAVVGLCSRFEDENEKEVCEQDGGRLFISIVIEDYSEEEPVPLFGAFCTGNYSYIWNSGYLFNGKYSDKSPVDLTYTEKGKSESKHFPEGEEKPKLIKVRDVKRNVCKNAVSETDYTVTVGSSFNIGEVDSGFEPESLLSSGGYNLAVYDFSAMTPAVNTAGNVSFYSISFILGTVQGGINVTATGDFCKTPNSTDESFDNCIINKFNFAAQAIGKG